MGDLGDLGEFLKEGAVSDLDWLDVNEDDYHQMDTLPKQNLDIRPDLEALWDREGNSATNYLVPNAGVIPNALSPHTMGDMSEEHGPLRNQAEDIRKIARLALIQSTDLNRFQSALSKRFDASALRQNRQVLASVLQERGLLGRFYIDAADFPGCHNSPKSSQDFVRKFAKEAKFILAKSECAECLHCKESTTGGSNCAVFHKQVELEVPYTEEMAAAVERANNRSASKSKAPKERIRLAVLQPGSEAREGVYRGQGEGRVRVQLATVGDEAQRVAAQERLRALPVVNFLKREMVKGLSESDLRKSLRLAFDESLLEDTKGWWGQLMKEAGLYGVVWTTQGSFEECRTGADFFAKHNPSVRAVVAGDKCSGCIYNKASRCLMYGKKLVTTANQLYTPETVEQILLEHRTAGRIPAWEGRTASSWGDSPRAALKAIHKAVTVPQKAPQTASARLDHMVAFHGGQQEHVASRQTVQQIVKQAGQFMNEGLYGKDLLRVLKGRFEIRDLVAAKTALKTALVEQGLQGTYFIDPTVYDDFGKGCDKAASLHRSRVVEYVKQSDKCSSCVHQRRMGFCSKINKPLVNEPPYANKRAQQREILASGSTMNVDLASLVHNGASMMAEYEMQNSMMVDVAPPVEKLSAVVEFHNGKIDL